MFDPIELSKRIKKLVVRDDERKYYRFRATRFYGGIATADCVGCNLHCIYCWAFRIVSKPEEIGKFYSPAEVANQLIGIANHKGFNQVRISGNEPTLGKQHLLKVLELIPKDLNFVLETNGLLIGYDENYAKELSKFSNLHVRVSLKGSSEEEFTKLTGAKSEAFELQFKALENLINVGVSCHAAVIDLAGDLDNLRERLKEIADIELEIEPLLAYPQVMARLKKAGIEH